MQEFDDAKFARYSSLPQPNAMQGGELSDDGEEGVGEILKIFHLNFQRAIERKEPPGKSGSTGRPGPGPGPRPRPWAGRGRGRGRGIRRRPRSPGRVRDGLDPNAEPNPAVVLSGCYHSQPLLADGGLLCCVEGSWHLSSESSSSQQTFSCTQKPFAPHTEIVHKLRVQLVAVTIAK